ncbi:Protein DOG1-like 3 [Vitis vinifera]|uniref:Protein DOG1-like 3 n=3 Tax=Vitis vinifera TaxID=29760 RepID=A0A438KJ44_VITVI|nr:Protein DOG1-like 3 [Vitis vinifera]
MKHGLHLTSHFEAYNRRPLTLLEASCLLPTYMASSPANHEGFHKFFESWLTEQNQHLQELISASRNNQHTDDSDQILCPLVERVVSHYHNYYHAKSLSTRDNILSMLTPPWRSLLEDAFLWVGGWRPSVAFHLLYSKSGLQFESGLADLIRGLSTGDLGDMSHEQLCRVDELQRKTIREEREMTENMARIQETVADSKMVELSEAATEEGGGGDDLGERVESALKHKEEGLAEMLLKADDLRLRTLKGVLDILTPMQCVHFLIAAAELHLRLHKWGKNKDEQQHHV